MSKKTKVKKSIRLTSMAVLVTGLVVSPVNINTSIEKVNAATNTTVSNVQADSPVISLVNGDFENPIVTASSKYQLFNESQVPGWQTTATDYLIEIQKKGLNSVSPESGNQWAELNANQVAALYQDIPTTPGVKVHWQVYHKGRKGTDVALVEFGAPGGTLVQQTQMSDGTATWGLYKGTYTIPEGQTTTRFQFRAVSSTGGAGVGNLLDNVQFATGSILTVDGTFSKSTIQAKNQVDYQIQATNSGGMPAANNHFSVQIPNELTYTPGTLSSSDTSVTEENYDEATRTLTFTTDSIKKDASIHIVIPLTGQVETNAASPDTTVTYNDENFDEETSTLEATDSSVEITSNEVPTITGETTTTLQPGDTFDPTSTMTASDKEDGDITSNIQVIDNSVDTSKSGTYKVTYEVTDSDNNTAQFTRTVIVTEAPIITGDIETRLNPNETFDDPMSTIQATDKEDGDLTDQVKITNNNVDISTPGSYEVTYEVTDSDGNKTTFTRTVMVTEAPTIAGNKQTAINPNSTFDPMSTMTAKDREDGDITGDIQVADNPVNTSKSGSYEVTYEVTDSDGNKATFTRTVIVTEAPAITGDSETILNPNATFDPMNTMIATDKEDGDITGDIQVVDNPVDTSKPGSYEVAYEVTDSDGNKSTFTRTITVTEPPRISGESETYLSPNATFDPMNTMTATDKEDGNITSSINVTNNTVDTSKPGNYEVTYEVTDSDGNKASFTRTVVVTEAPIITGDSETQLNLNADFDPMSTIQATDKEDSDITNAVKVTNNTVDTSKPGSYFVTYEVIDSDGNISDTFIRTVIVTEAPTISGDSETRLNPNADFDPMSTIQAKDKEDGDITSAVKVTNNSVDTSKSGSYEVTYEVTDSDGNKAVFTRTVIVTEAPIISGDSETVLNPSEVFDPMSTIQAKDKEDGDITSNVKVTDNPVDTLTPGSYEVTYEVTDSDGNKETFTRTVIVTEAPTITGESETILNPNAMFDPMSTMKATDKEDGDITQNIQVTNNTVDTSKPGSYLVTYEVTDSDGNISSTFIRTVIVTEAPIINGDSETHIKPEDHFDPMEGITATDKENGDLTEQIKIISNNVDVNVPGNYQVVYEVTDSDGNVTTFTSTVVVDLINQPSERSKDTTNPPKDMQSGKNEVEKKIIETKSDAKTEEKVSLPKTGDQSNTPTGLAGLGLFVVGLFAFFRIKK
ncbi:immunoglobulin-like domain-containing protein [Listeria seeligeri]|uniref:immunoglobulin-like domain-containing protein n=1 Tax=Listeria seeligeri TaxID=1640 RepID=UPI0022EBE1D3|nr:immunoglobulin-like domain-containing protein [Listeria seeligeri]